MTTIELKEQMKALKNQQKEANKQMTKIKKEYEMYRQLRRNNLAFRYAIAFEGKYESFEELIHANPDWDNQQMSKLQFEFLFNQLKYTDIRFFTMFMNWDYEIFDIPIDDRTCPVCFSYYTCRGITRFNKFDKCKHMCCLGCYHKLSNPSGHKICVICRQSESPVV